MRLLRKIIAVVLAAVVLLGCSVTGFALSFTDVTENSPYNEAISTMVSLGLLKGYDDGTFRPNDTITRAEFAAVITRAIGLEEIAASTSSVEIFTDMSTNGAAHWASGYVRVAYDKKIILGMGDGTFAPDDPITYEQAVKMIVCTLGREAAANDKGGYPGGYILEANDINLTRNATMSPTNGPAPRGMVAQLVFNSLEIKFLERSVSGAMVQVDKTLLNDMLKVKKFTNYMVTDVDGIVGAASNAREGELVLESGNDSSVYTYKNAISNAAAKDMVGVYVSGYYKVNTETEERVLLQIGASSSRSDEIVVNSDDIEKISGRRLEYWIDRDNDIKTKIAKISENARLIYNGVTFNYLTAIDVPSEQRNLGYWLSYWFEPDSDGFINGKVRFVDAESDGEFDAVFIDDYEVYVIKTPVSTNDATYSKNYVIADYYDASRKIQIDPYAQENTVNIYNARTGAKMNIESIKAMNVVSVAASRDYTNFTCYVSTDTITGSISSVSMNKDEYMIGKKEYKLTDEFKNAVDKDLTFIELEASGTFYLDMNGKIAAANLTAVDNGNYMYIIRAGKNDIMGDNASAEVIALSGSPSTPERIRVASSVRINDKNYTNADDVVDVLKKSAGMLKSNQDGFSSEYSQLAKVKIGTGKDGQKEITSIKTAARLGDNGWELKVGGNASSSELRIIQEYKNLLYSESSGFQNQVLINDSTQVLVVPTKRTDKTSYSRSVGKRAFSTGSSYQIEAYDISGNYAKVVVVYGDSADVEIKNDTPASLVKSNTEMKSDISDDTVRKIQVYENNSLVVYETENNSDEYAALQPGDVVRFGFNGSGQINKFEYQVRASEPEPKLTQITRQENGEWKFKSAYGTVSTFRDDLLMIAADIVQVDEETSAATLDRDQQESFQIKSGAPVYLVNVTGSRTSIEESSIDLVSIFEFGLSAEGYKDASMAYACAVDGETKMVVLYSAN